MSDPWVRVGLLYRGTVRRFLEEAEFNKQILEWKEIKGFGWSKFLLKGASPLVLQSLSEWVDKANEG